MLAAVIWSLITRVISQHIVQLLSIMEITDVESSIIARHPYFRTAYVIIFVPRGFEWV